MFDDLSSSALRVAVAGLRPGRTPSPTTSPTSRPPATRPVRSNSRTPCAAPSSTGDSPAAVAPSTATSLEPTRLNGSNVNLDEETLSHIDTTMRYQLTLRALDSKYGMLRDAIKGA